MSTIESVLITGANIGLGKDTARQLALRNEVKKIYLAGRNPDKVAAAKQDLEQQTGRKIFESVIVDTTDFDSIRAVVDSLPGIDALVMNAGGVGGKTPMDMTKDGVTYSFGVNVLGHALLLESLLAQGKLGKVAVFVSSEATRGVRKMAMKAPVFNSQSVDEFASVTDGSLWSRADPMVVYG
jgi:NAD(P)-dependent dehydrogenase (short-subunit alcohol dehydrogenase family)